MSAPNSAGPVNKSDPQGGIRTRGVGTKAGEWTAAGAAAVLIMSYVPSELANPMQQNFWSILLTAFFKEVAAQLTARGFLKNTTPMAMVLICLLPLGCAVQLGQVHPNFYTGADGETVVACDVKGVSLSFGDADICRNVEGGHVSRTFADMTLGLVRAAGAIVAGFFTGLGGAGAGVQAALAPEVPATPLPAPSANPAASEVDLMAPTSPFFTPR